MLVIIGAKYGKNPSRTVDFFSKVKAKNLQKIQISRFWKKRNTPSYNSDHLCQI